MAVTLADVERYLSGHRPTPLPYDGLKRAAVLFPFIEENGQLEILLTQRTDLVEHHKGQVAFPGGMMDREDRDSEDTALREAREEIGLQKEDVRLMGRTTELITPTGFIITPVIAQLKRKPPLVLSQDEVEAAFYAPVGLFFDPAAEVSSVREWEGERQTVYSYEHDGYRIWGVTAAIIRRFLREVAGQRP